MRVHCSGNRPPLTLTDLLGPFETTLKVDDLYP